MTLIGHVLLGILLLTGGGTLASKAYLRAEAALPRDKREKVQAVRQNAAARMRPVTRPARQYAGRAAGQVKDAARQATGRLTARFQRQVIPPRHAASAPASQPARLASVSPITARAVPAQPQPGPFARPAPAPVAGSAAPVSVAKPDRSLNGRTTAVMTAPAPARSVPADYASLISRVGQFEPDDHGELLRFMAGEASGMAGYAEAVAQTLDTCRASKGLDPSSVTAMGDVAEIVSEAAAAMLKAAARFRSVYAGVIETVENGTVMPHDGRFFSGNGA